MQEIIITTLLKFNDIFDAFQQIFKIHNYNSYQQRQILEKCLDQQYLNSSIYITLNSNNQFFPNYQDLEQIQLKFSNDKLFNQNNLIELIQTNVQNETKEFIKSFDQLCFNQNEKLNDFKSYVSDIFLTKNDIRQFKSNSEDKINKLQDQIQQFQTKYALKLYTEQHIIDIKQAISQIQQANVLIKQDSQTLHKLNSDNRFMIKQLNEQLIFKIENMEKEQYRIFEFEKDVEKMKNIIQEQKCENEILQNKVRSLSQLFQELEVNNSKVVRFEIHSALKKVDEEMNYFKNRQQSFQDQLQFFKENFQKSEISNNQFQNVINEQFDSISAELVQKKQQFKSILKNIALLQQQEKNQISSDLPQKVAMLLNKVSTLEQTSQQAFDQLKRIIDVIQEFCETLQIPSDSQQKNLTNLILLLDRRILEYGKSIYDQQIQSVQGNTVKINTARISTSVDSTFKVGVLKEKKTKFNKLLNKTVYYGSRRDTLF
ncbi:unnamed protein product [Paramecium sonneborni]|uniref:Uncharacterized protein n=1 Tax=Paramecium sonneborni TaxID=65129 RepID=A0A8S1NG66_9CILI|nr:unnamed protein product [Paramecium sonneborni]